MNRPNIVYLHSHDTGRYLEPYGHAIPTPRLQQLAEEGVLFRKAFCAAPTCSPSRAALLTGQSAHSSGMLGLAHRGFALHDYGQHLVHTLRGAGYVSALAGVQHLARDPGVIGYDQIVPTKNSSAAQVAPAAAEFLRNAPPRPFFLDVGFSETHRKFPPPGPSDDPRYCLPPHPLPDTPETRHDMAAYKTIARLLDAGVGTVLDALEAGGLAGNTLVISTTDHGIAFPGMKCSLTDHGIGVSLIVRGPGGFDGGKVIDALVSHIDLFPTLCELLEIERPSWLQGESLLPLVRGEADEINDAVFAEVTFHAAFEPKRAVRTQRWKYIRHFDDRHRPVLPNCDDSPSKDVWLRHGWRDRPVAAEQLYDLVFDPGEACNLAGDPSLEAVLGEMRDRLDRWMHATNDPLLQDPLPLPAGILVNSVDGISPSEPAGAP
jgi:arylsulfatase A-like enzyme